MCEIRGRDLRLQLRKPRNLVTTCTYEAHVEVMPHRWACSECKHKGWLKSTLTCEACGEANKVVPVPNGELPNLLVICNAEDGKACAWGDVTGNELDIKLTVQARKEEMEQFKKHGVH